MYHAFLLGSHPLIQGLEIGDLSYVENQALTKQIPKNSGFFHFFQQDARFLIKLSSLIIESTNRFELLNFTKFGISLNLLAKACRV